MGARLEMPSTPMLIGAIILICGASLFGAFSYGKYSERDRIRVAILEKDNDALRQLLEDQADIAAADRDSLVDELLRGSQN